MDRDNAYSPDYLGTILGSDDCHSLPITWLMVITFCRKVSLGAVESFELREFQSNQIPRHGQ